MPIALGTARTEMGMEGGRGEGVGGAGKADNRNRPIVLMRWGKPVKNWRATKGKCFPLLKIGGTSPLNRPS